MSSDQPRRGRDTIGAGSAGSPMGSTAAIIIAVVAVVAGFLILRQIRSDDGGSATVPPSITTVPLDTSTGSSIATVTTPPAASTSTIFVPTVDGATVVVANASTVDGAAGRLTTSLQGQGFTTAAATNSTAKQEDTTILYDPSNTGALPVAQSLGVLINVSIIQEVPSPAPVNGGVLPDGASVVVMLGSDKATLTLEQMGTPTTVAGASTSLPPVGGATASSAP
jgi:hypothetical protein